MFDRYTEKARRVIFFARFEASHYGTSEIESEQLLLGLVRECKGLDSQYGLFDLTHQSLRNEIAARTAAGGQNISTSMDLPLSTECKHILACAAEEADLLGHRYIGTEHLLLGLLREEGCLAARLLKERGAELERIRKALKNPPGPPNQGQKPKIPPPPKPR